MPNNKPPRKKYTKRDIVTPLNMRDAWKIEGDCHAFLLCMDAGSLHPDHVAATVAHVDMVRRITREPHVKTHCETVLRILADMHERHQATGKLYANTSEAPALHASLAITLEASRKAKSIDILKASNAARRDLDKLGGVVVERRTGA